MGARGCSSRLNAGARGSFRTPLLPFRPSQPANPKSPTPLLTLRLALCVRLKMAATTVVVPCYNEEKRLNTTEFVTYFREQQDTKVLFVDDGSTDQTAEVLMRVRAALPSKVRRVQQKYATHFFARLAYHSAVSLFCRDMRCLSRLNDQWRLFNTPEAASSLPSFTGVRRCGAAYISRGLMRYERHLH